MSHVRRIPPQTTPMISPLMLCDRLISLAEDADHAGFSIAAEHLLELANEVLDRPCKETPLRKH